jgi:hypothetical protein
MATTSNKKIDEKALQQVAFWQDENNGVGALNIEGLVQLADSNGDVIDPSTGASAATGGGSSTYSTAQGDITATPTVGTTNITVTGLPFTLTAEQIANGVVKRIASDGTVTVVDTGSVVVSGGVITLADADNFVSGDTVSVSLTGPDKAYDEALDSNIVSVLNPDYAHWTSVEHLIDESDLGIDATYDGGGAQDLVMTDTGETYTAATVAEGYTIYNVTQATSALITADTLSGLAGDGGAGNPTADDITHAALGANWVDTNVASIPEVKRFVVPAEGFNLVGIDVLLDSQDDHNSCYVKIYSTLDPNADDTDDIYWKDISADVFGASQLSADGIGDAARAVTQGIYWIDTPTVTLKYMIKIVAECDNGVQNNEFDIRIKKSSNG